MTTKEIIAVLQAFDEGKDIEVQLTPVDGKYWTATKTPSWNFSDNKYRIKPKPTREEITALWVKENNIVVGSKVKVVKGFKEGFGGIYKGLSDECVGEILSVTKIKDRSIQLDDLWVFPVESLEPCKEQFVPFTWEDRDLFRYKWIKTKNGFNEHKINFIGKASTVSCANWDEEEYLSSLFESHEFIDGTPFGKLA